MKTIELSTGTLLVSSRSVPINTDLDDFQLLGHPSEITGEVWGRVEDGFNDEYDSIEERRHYFTNAHNIQESDVLLFKAKNKEG